MINMGDLSASDCSWKKMVLAKTNNKWIPKIKSQSNNSENPKDSTITEECLNQKIKQEIIDSEDEETDIDQESRVPTTTITSGDPLLIDVPVEILGKDRFEATLNTPTETPSKRKQRKKSAPKNETPEERILRLAKMSAYAARRLATESPEQRASRLKRMSEYAAKRLSQESVEQRARRLARMSAYAAQRLANETPEQRNARLTRMSAYAARRQAMRKSVNGDPSQDIDLNNMTFTLTPDQS